MGVKQVKVDVNELVVGMFVSGLDRPWTQTPFPLQGFYVRDLDEIRELKIHCKHVYIDVAKGRGVVSVKHSAAPVAPNKPGILSPKQARSAKHERANIQVGPLKIRGGVYGEFTQPLKVELSGAQQLHSRMYRAVSEVMQHIGEGGDVPIHETKRYASQMVDSVLRNPDAFTWLSRVQEVDEYTYAHVVRSSVWAILFGRHIGLPKSDLETLSMGVLLKDVGKTQLSRDLLAKQLRSPDEVQVFESFVDKGVEMLRNTSGVEPRVISVVKTHCERINGSGFPQHLRGDKIPLLGKIAGIVTFYDYTTNPRDQKHPMSPSKAVAKLYELRDIEFQEELVVEFIRAIGLYPTGTLVELSTGEVGVVVEQNFSRRLKPKVMVVLDSFKQRLPKPVLLDLAVDERNKQKQIDEGKKTRYEVEMIEIARDLEPGSYDVDVNAIRDKYIFSQMVKPKKGLFSFFKR
ncbi:HD-GYP domain-containing protein [Marinibactrum halimedae]|uniref:HD family phosphohydrolase n=1 Tax=Marinibactrum halimedae TaxID=1444977 RepID=A0AA37T048_9GAMM|nr:DUF3391 domain-containing protein [Marinibactrum halimedae]MCD9459734.1 DUF3391 domain-containing protein [Marinibactrum halimedae]GLS24509.1 HD family phosphohydrolase [Marinibactrum halimedae]